MGKKTSTKVTASTTKAAPAKASKAEKVAAPEVVEDSLTVAMKKANDLRIRKYLKSVQA